MMLFLPAKQSERYEMVTAQRQETVLRPKIGEEPSMSQELHKLTVFRLSRGTEGNHWPVGSSAAESCPI